MLQSIINENNGNFFWSETLVVIVLYNMRLSDSLTFRSLQMSIKACNLPYAIDVMICDNSLVKQEHDYEVDKHRFFNINYSHDPTNPGVSHSYNKAAIIAEKQEKKWLLVLDHDTELPQNFVHKYQEVVIEFPNFPIYAPQLYSNQLLFSPCKYWFLKGSNLPSIEPGIHIMKHKNVLNSGLLISLIAFQEVDGYDEKVQLYFSDFVFFDRLKKKFREFVVIDCRLEHQLSSVDYTDIALALTRFEYYCKGARGASRNNFFAYINQFVNVGLRSMLMSYRFKSYKFTIVFIDSFLQKIV